MTSEPDEAMRYARLRAKGRMSSPNNPHRTIERRVEVDAGKHDAELSDEAHAYRAGQAASAERIKALEEAIRRLTNMLAESDDPPGLIMVVTKDLLNARALLKEADQ